MNLPNYLVQRTPSNIYYVRWMVPVHARRAIGRSEFIKSLGTRDRRQAGRLALPILAGWRAAVDRAVGPTYEAAVTASGSTGLPCTSAKLAPTSFDLEQLAVTAGYENVGKRVEELIESKAKGGIEVLNDLAEKLDVRRAEYNRMLIARDLSLLGGTAQKVLEKRTLALDEGTPEFEQFAMNVGRAVIDAHAKGLARIRGDEGGFVPSDFVQKTYAKRRATAKPGERILELFERYAAQRLAEKRKRQDTVNQDRKVLELFAQFVGEDRAIRSITTDDIVEWRTTLEDLPPNYRKRADYRGLSLREAAAKARQEGTRGLSKTTVNKHLSTVSPLFAWCRRLGLAGPNPCDGLFFDLPKGDNRRPPFSVEQLNRMLRSPLFTGFEADGTEHLPGDKQANDWRFWVPLVCLFTGARIGEIAQLRVGDVKSEHGRWFIHIKHNEANGQFTKSKKSRPAPVHSKLAAIGFLAFHEGRLDRASRDGNDQLFPELTPNERGQISGRPSRFWRDYLADIGLKLGKDGLGAHSFRHTFADQLRIAGYFDDKVAVALGHSTKTVTSGYGRLDHGTVSTLSEMFEAVTFEGVDFSHLFGGRSIEAF